MVNRPDDYIKIINNDIDWENVNILKSRLIRGSFDFLEEALSL